MRSSTYLGRATTQSRCVLVFYSLLHNKNTLKTYFPHNSTDSGGIRIVALPLAALGLICLIGGCYCSIGGRFSILR
ncbi:hypothetical protein BDU57DRAFT_180444 [Ampelomyces quisqualis]|uniref:Uncharacterized protein n=1 Tax=Ampelomyces quisqualis TaxID=50730 RepID=A0A6A5QRA5_AMPQU|nr:hypothetical protein BDU57DRAFT_180444 [Ampelomyces quisqualis]